MILMVILMMIFPYTVYALTGQEHGAFVLGVVALQKSAIDGADLQAVFYHD